MDDPPHGRHTEREYEVHDTPQRRRRSGDSENAFTSTLCILLTLVVMFVALVTLQIYLVESPTIQDLLGFNVTFKSDIVPASNGSPHLIKHDTSTPSTTSTSTPALTTSQSPTTTPIAIALNAPATKRTVRTRKTWRTLAPNPFTMASDQMYQHYRSFCVHHPRRRSRDGQHYDLKHFPYHLCTDVVYCCATIDPEEVTIIPRNVTVDVYKNAYRRFRALKNHNAHLRVWLAVGGGDWDPDDTHRSAYSKISREQQTRVHFAANAVDWLETYAFDGVFVYWKFPEVHETAFLIELLGIMKEAFRRLSLYVGVIVPLNQELRERFDMRELVDLMDDYSILVDPTDPGPRTFGKTELKYSQDDLDRYSELFRETRYVLKGHKRSGKFQLCYPLFLAGTAFTLYVPGENISTGAGQDTSGPGRAGHSTKTAGLLAFDEICHRKRWDAVLTSKYCKVAVDGDQWVSFVTVSTLGAFVHSLMKVTGNSRCFGVWEPYWDDYADHCNQGAYPLTTAVFNAQRRTAIRENERKAVVDLRS